jgi:transcriptional regulator with XRE-family HTH domain
MPRTTATNLQLRQRVAARLRQARLNKGLSQEQLAEAMKISAESVSRYERGQLALSLELLSRASRVLDVPIEQLVGKGPVGLSAEETELVEGWRRLSAQGQRVVLEVVALVVASSKAARAARSVR